MQQVEEYLGTRKGRKGKINELDTKKKTKI
jgi:hypothetical protein